MKKYDTFKNHIKQPIFELHLTSKVSLIYFAHKKNTQVTEVVKNKKLNTIKPLLLKIILPWYIITNEPS